MANEKKWKILLVDDNPRTIKLVGEELSSPEIELLTAQSAEEATRILLDNTTRPALVLLDVIMPGVDGGKLCRFIKGNEMFRDIKVLLYSSMEEKKLEEVATECGADGWLHKKDILGKWVMEQLRKEELQTMNEKE